jgi:hypothetical protein
MPEKARGFILRRNLKLQDVSWGKVLDLLSTRFRLDYQAANTALQSFFRRFTLPFNLGWFITRELNERENQIAVAICEVHAADALELSFERLVGYGPLKGHYHLQASIEPALRFRELGLKGKVSALVELGLFGKTISLHSPFQVALAALLLWGLSIAVALIFAGLLIYSLAVFFEFLQDPFEITLYALEKGSVGLSLLCFLVAVSAICGRALTNLLALFRAGVEPQLEPVARGKRHFLRIPGFRRVP